MMAGKAGLMQPLNLDDRAPWKERFRTPWIVGSAIASRDPARGLVHSNESGRAQLYRWHTPTNEREQLTSRPGGIQSYYFSPDGRFVYYLEDDHGNEIGHFVRLPYNGGEAVDVTPDLPLYSPAGFALSRDGSMLGLTAGTQGGFHLYAVSLDPDGNAGESRLLYHSRRLFFGPHLSYEGTIAVIASTEKSDRPDFALLAFDTRSGEKIGELWDGDHTSIAPIKSSPVPGDSRLLAHTNRSGFEQLLLWDPLSGERRDLVFPELTGVTSAFDWSQDGRRILVRNFANAVQQLYAYDLSTDSLTRLQHPSGTISSAYFVENGDIYAHLQDGTHRPRLLALDGETGEPRRVVLAASEAPPGRPWRSVTLSSSDGQEIQGWLATPEGDGPFPTVIEMIGGPGGVRTEVFMPESQAWLDHGFAWLSINYRGCATFGREFQSRIFGDVGHWEVEDIVAARSWLIEQGIARPDAVLLTGWSYGGFLTLLTLGKRPPLWAGGMAGVAIANWAIQYEDSAEMLRGYQVALFGGTPEEVPERYTAGSPITYAERVQAPVIIIQGRNDTRTPARPIELYEQKMREMGKDITVHWFEAGHAGGAMDVHLAIAHQELFLRFAYRVLGAS
jgi:dipeptidyl aminopeptidase/acylaminoacyl peptidase